MADFEIVPRPVKRAGPGALHTPLLLALMQTVTSGQSVRVPLNGENVSKVQSRLRESLRRRDFALRYQKDGDAIVCWAVPRHPIPPETS